MNNVNDPTQHGIAPDEREFSPSTCEEYNRTCCENDKNCIYDGKWFCAECIVIEFQDEIDAIILEECGVSDWDETAFLEDCTITEFINVDDDENFIGLFVLTPSNAVPRVVITDAMIEAKRSK
jgi:hypothetical protein